MHRVAVIFDHFGPYHRARLTAAARRMNTVGIELCGLSVDYAWDKIGEPAHFEHRTVFPKFDSQSISPSEWILRVGKLLDEIQPDAVAIPGWVNKGALSALLWCRRNHVPSIIMSESTRADASRSFLKETVKARLVGMCSAGLAGGGPQSDYLHELSLPRETIFSGYDVVDNSYFSARSETHRRDAARLRQVMDLPENFFLACNRFIPKKNLPVLLQAFASYRHKAGQAAAWKLVLLGDGPQKSEILEIIHSLGLEGAVKLPGFKQYAELPAYFSLARVFVHASTVEQWGLVVNEAMACGLPVLVSERCGCARDLVHAGKNGFAFDPARPEELAEYMFQCSNDSLDLASFGQASLDIIAQWSPARFALGLEQAVSTARLLKPTRPNPFDRCLLHAALHS